jgi:integration host factor subunit alpha
MTLTKSQIAEAICNGLGFTKGRSQELVETLLEIIKKSLVSGDDVMISGFGKFCVREKGERRGRNPATGTDMMLRPRKVVTFKCSGNLRNKINTRPKNPPKSGRKKS